MSLRHVTHAYVQLLASLFLCPQEIQPLSNPAPFTADSPSCYRWSPILPDQAFFCCLWWSHGLGGREISLNPGSQLTGHMFPGCKLVAVKTGDNSGSLPSLEQGLFSYWFHTLRVISHDHPGPGLECGCCFNMAS